MLLQLQPILGLCPSLSTACHPRHSSLHKSTRRKGSAKNHQHNQLVSLQLCNSIQSQTPIWLGPKPLSVLEVFGTIPCRYLIVEDLEELEGQSLLVNVIGSLQAGFQIFRITKLAAKLMSH
jgi:hypothetical protein